MKEVPKKYNPEVEEKEIIEFWEKSNTFSFDKNSKKKLYSIDTPPPYASAGHLHIGHAMSYSHAEFIARYKRMAGFNVFYPMGFDDNGLPTERYVERKHNVNKNKITREEFIRLCLKETENVRAIFKKLWQRLGLSVDWKQTYSTIDPYCQTIAQRSFIDLYKKNLMQHIDAPTAWDVSMQTAVAQADFENIEKKSHFNDISFHDKNGKELIISTTRPELLPACVGLFAHPEDERYAYLKNEKAIVPLFNYEVPILFDEAVEKDVGTGLMMVCTFGDKEDIDKWQRHNLDLRVVIQENGKLSSLAKKYEGMKIKEARLAIIEDLKESGDLKSQKEITHNVNVHDRSSVEIEFVKKKQWYIDVIGQKEKFIEYGKKIKWNPEFMKVRYDNWVENLNWNWNISRQRFYGVPFPVWYSKKTGEVVLPNEDQLPVDPSKDFPNTLPEGHSKEDIIPEQDVMDTWMTSSVSPQINYRWKEEDEVKEMIPMDLRPQAHDIIRTWAFYTIAKSVYHNEDIPWKEIVISGHGQDPKGQKMSKSKGNVVWVDDVLKKYSADALRFWAAGSGLGVDCPYQEKDVQNGNKLVTKMWNASKFTDFLLQEKFDKNTAPELTPFDRWMLTKLNTLIETVTAHFENNDFDKVKYFADQFFWKTLCDDYLEIVKDRLYKPEVYGEKARLSGEYTLYNSVKTLVQIFHPIIPFITESVWQYFFSKYEDSESIANSSWPQTFTITISNEEHLAGQLAVDIISEIRRFKSENQKSLNAEVELKVFCDDIVKKQLELVLNDIKGTVKANTITFVKREDIRADITIAEAETKDVSIEADEKNVPTELEFLSIDVEFVEKDES